MKRLILFLIIHIGIVLGIWSVLGVVANVLAWSQVGPSPDFLFGGWTGLILGYLFGTGVLAGVTAAGVWIGVRATRLPVEAVSRAHIMLCAFYMVFLLLGAWIDIADIFFDSHFLSLALVELCVLVVRLAAIGVVSYYALRRFVGVGVVSAVAA